MSNLLAGFFDEFNLRARAYPALLMLMPALVAVQLLWPSSPLLRVGSFAASIGALYLLTDFVRGAGQALERRLDDDWQGLPAQRALHISGNEKSAAVKLRRSTVEALLGERLPSGAAERKDPGRAREAYDLAVRSLIGKVRGRDKDELLHQENIRYNFRRNMLAIRSVAVAIAGTCLALEGWLFWQGIQRGPATAAAIVSLGMLLVWIIGVRKAWVRQAGETYSKRFYDALQRVVGTEVPLPPPVGKSGS